MKKLLITLFILLSFSAYAVNTTTVADVEPACCTVLLVDSLGSGIVVYKDNNGMDIITCQHVVKKALGCLLRFGLDNASINGEIVRTDREKDLALIHTDTPLSIKPVPFSTRPLVAGEEVFNWGAPSAVDHFVSFGHIADSSTRMVEGQPKIMACLPVTFGMSGSGLCNNQGELVGIVEAGIIGTSINVVIPASVVQNFYEQKTP